MTGYNSDATGPKDSPTKILHVEIPEPVYWHLRRCAIESQMSLKAFVTDLGRTASPFKLRSLDSYRKINDESESIERKAA